MYTARYKKIWGVTVFFYLLKEIDAEERRPIIYLNSETTSNFFLLNRIHISKTVDVKGFNVERIMRKKMRVCHFQQRQSILEWQVMT